jgi:hypothetical protein
MTYRDSDGWRLTSPLAQHAAPLPITSPVRHHTQKALRLFVTAGTWAAGLCLVIGSIVLVVKAAGPGRGAGSATDSSVHTPVPGNDTVASAGYGIKTGSSAARASYHQLAQFAGRGNDITRRFLVKAGTGWQLKWSYSCPAGTRNDQLTVKDAASAPPGRRALAMAISAAGIHGHGTIWFDPNGTSHDLIVLSNCSWTMKVGQSR